MPNRIIREAILTSERVCALAWPEEVFYRRLMSIVDDYGRCEAHPQLLRSKCYPLQTDQVRAADITRWMAACQKAGVILCYEVDRKQYLEVLNFGQQQRSASKCPPPPPLDGNCYQELADAHLVVSVSEVVSESVSPPAPSGGDVLFEEFWAAYPKKVGKDAARKAFAKRKPVAALVQQMVQALEWQKRREQWRKDDGQFIPHPATWLNEARWEDSRPGDTAAPAPGRDPALKKLDEDEKKAAPMPPDIRARIEDALKGKVLQ